MDIISLAAVLIVMALMFYAIDQIPFGNPPWLKNALKALLAVAAALWLAQKFLNISVG